MTTAVLKAFSIFCNFGGPFIAPFFAPIMNLLNFMMLPISLSSWLILLISCFIPIYYSNLNDINSTDKQNKNAARSFGFAALFYYISMVIIFCIGMQFTCKFNSQYNPM